jgi:hypothetical protein
MVLEVVAALNHSVDIAIGIRNDDLEGTEELSTAEVEIVNEFFKTDLNSCGLVRPINFRNVMRNRQRLSSEEKLGAWNFHNRINMTLDAFVIPSKNGANSEVIQSTTFG